MTSGLYHVNEEGNPGKCSARNGNCPFGGEDSHFTSPEAARHSYEEKQSKKEQAVTSWKRKPVAKPASEPAYSGHGRPIGHGLPDVPSAPRARRASKPKAPAPKINPAPIRDTYTGHGRFWGSGHGRG